MHDEFYIEMIRKDLTGSLNSEESALLEKWKTENKDLSEDLYRSWQISEEYGNDIEVDIEADYQRLQRRLKTDEKKIIPFSPKRWLGIAASILLLVSMSYFLIQNQTNEIVIDASNDLKEVSLPDESKITLPIGSKLYYNSDYLNKRQVRLEGAAYFDIASDKEHPFKVSTSHLEIEVLGTVFFVRDHKDENDAKVQLIEGSVKVSDIRTSNSKTLNPNQVVSYKDAKLIVTKELEYEDFEEVFGSMSFVNEKLEIVVNRIENIFNVSIQIDSNIKECSFTGNLKSKSLKQVLNAIKGVYNAQIDSNPAGYTISGEACS